jgi:nucleoside-triphosphatase
VIKLAERLRERGLRVGGIVSREVKRNNARVGFEFVDLVSNETYRLASTEGRGPRMGKYVIDLDGCRFASERLIDAMEKYDVIICDELGPMEFRSEEFVECARNMLDLDKPMIVVVVHKRLQHPVIDQYRRKARFSINIDMQNRNKAVDTLLERL